MIVAGGMNILTNPDGFAGLSKAFFLSNTGNCKTWDSQADGYCRADGVGSVVMKRLEDALADNDNILGVIAAATTNHSAEAISITHPDSDAQSHLFRQVIGRAGIDPLDVGYVELHGTGTQAGDSNELRSVTDVFAPSKQGRSAKQPLFISAAKANVGHGEAAAGIMSLIKTLCVLQKEAIPPHIGIKNELTPSIPQDTDKRNIHIPYRSTPWPRLPERKRIAVVNNFGAAGGNTALVIEDGPERQIQETDPRSTHVLVVSAKNAVSLERNIERLLSYIRSNPEVALHDLAYTLTARKAHYSHRVGFAVSEGSHFEKLYSMYLATNAPLQPVRGTRPPVAFAFTCQGSFYPSMASQLFKDSPPFRNCILDLDGLCQRQGFDSILPAMDGQAKTGHKFSLATHHLAILCVEMALFSLWEQLGVSPDIVVGHSLGEFAAFHAAGVVSASDAIFLVGQRARFLERLTEAGTFGMMAVRATPEKVKTSIGENACHIACINGPEDLVLTGTTEALSSAAGLLRSDDCKTLLLDISRGFHSPQMDIILDDYERVAEAAVFHKPKLPVISPLLSRVVQEGGTINAQYVRRATREAVDFMGALQAAEMSSFINEKTVWLELGPQPLCCGFVRSSIRNASLTLPSLCKNENDWATVSQTLCELHCAGVEINWKEFHRPYEKALRLLDLPTYAWNDRNYWIPYKGDWTLTKGSMSASHTISTEKTSPKLSPDLKTSSIHGIVEEVFDDHSVKLVVASNILDPDILAAVTGHAMNGFGVVSCVSYPRDHLPIKVKGLSEFEYRWFTQKSHTPWPDTYTKR
jgi:acyl transferase domain-containing protein